MSYTQWDKGFLEGYASGREAGLQSVREALLDMQDLQHKKVPIEYFELLNRLTEEATND